MPLPAGEKQTLHTAHALVRDITLAPKFVYASDDNGCVYRVPR